MKKVLVILAVVAVTALAALALVHTTTVTAQDETSTCLANSLLPDGSQSAVPMAECAKVSCGTCPGPNCQIDGICCWDQAHNQAGMASCGCTADGKPTCKCDVGAPR